MKISLFITLLLVLNLHAQKTTKFIIIETVTNHGNYKTISTMKKYEDGQFKELSTEKVKTGKDFWLDGKKYSFKSWSKKCIKSTKRNGKVRGIKINKVYKTKLNKPCKDSYQVTFKNGEYIVNGDGGKHIGDGDLIVIPDKNNFVFKNGQKCYFSKSFRECLSSKSDIIISKNGDILHIKNKSNSLQDCTKNSNGQSILCPDGIYIKSSNNDDSTRGFRIKEYYNNGVLKKVKRIPTKKQ